MAEPISRLVSGTATISIPAEWSDFREVYLSTAVVRPPKNKYLNANWTPSKSRYGTVSILAKGEYVRDSFPIEFDKQIFTLFSLQPSQNLLALICALEAILVSFVNLANAIPDTTAISKFNPIEEFTYTSIDFDRCIITCFADTALFISLIPVEMSKCREEDGSPEPPPPPPPPPPPVPPGTPLDGLNGSPALTPPQPGEPSDLNSPFPGDGEEPPPPPVGADCEVMTIKYTYFVNGDDIYGGEETGFFFAPIEGFEYVDTGNGNADFVCNCRGNAFNQECQPSTVQAQFIGNADQNYDSVVITITSIVGADMVEYLQSPLVFER